MTLLQLKIQPAGKGYNNFMTEFVPFITKENSGMQHRNPPLNIHAAEEGYRVEAIVPGFRKEDISISFEKNELTISAKVNSKEDAKTRESVRNEYQLQSFARSIYVDEKVDGNMISAEYVNGILTLNLPLKQPVKSPVQQIIIQ